MYCPYCFSKKYIKNGFRYGNQCYLCKSCRKQFINKNSAKTISCPRCGNKSIVKYGKQYGIQRYRCKACNNQFKINSPKTKSIMTRLVAILLYYSDYPLSEIADFVGLSTSTLSAWSREFANKALIDDPIAKINRKRAADNYILNPFDRAKHGDPIHMKREVVIVLDGDGNFMNVTCPCMALRAS